MAIQNPSVLTKGSLQIEDAYYDIRHAYNNDNKTFFITGYSGADPAQIQNLAEQQTGVVYGSGDGSLGTVNYQTEAFGSAITGLNGISSSVFASQNLYYVVAANQQAHAFTMVDRVLGGSYALNVPGIYRVSINPGATIAMGFVQNSNTVYSIVHLTAAQSQQLSGGPSTWPTLFPGSSTTSPVTVQDCEPQNLPVYCAVQVNNNANLFDHPIKAVFSSDGSTVWVVNCGPECGGTQASIVSIPIAASAFNGNTTGPNAIDLINPAGTNPQPTVIPIPNGATDVLQNGTSLYIAGQQLQSNGLFAGFLTVVDLSNNTIQGTYSISDGTHTKMLLGDDNTLWIAAQGCEEGVRYAQSQAGQNVALGCLTMYNYATNAVVVDSYKGDATGETDVEGLGKVYTAEGGQVYIYNTSDGSERDNSNVTVVGTAYDVAYMDAGTDGDDANY